MAILAINGNLLESIKEFRLDGIMNAANGTGPMGKGIAGAIRKHGGTLIQLDAIAVCKHQDPQEGEAYSTIAGKLEEQGIKKIIHAVTMKRPGGATSLDICEKAFKSALELAEKEGITKFGCTALGTGVGKLDSCKVAKRMLPLAKESKVDVLFMDFDNDFIDELKKGIEL